MKIGLIGILGEEYKTDLWGTLERVAALGYQGIEGAEPLLVGDVAGNIGRLHDLGLKVLTVSASPDALRNDLEGHIEKVKSAHSDRTTVWWSACDSRDAILRDAELYNLAGNRLGEEGITLCYHHHAHEFINTFDGVYALDLLAANTDPAALSFNIDIAWVFAGGEDPKRVLTKMVGRVPVIHIKDVATLGSSPKWTAIGTGLVGVADVVRHAKELGIPWGVVEQDQVRNLSPMETVAFSYHFLRESDLT